MSKAGDSCASTQNLIQPADQQESDFLSFGDNSEHDITSERGSVGQALLTSINRLNSNFQTFAQQFAPVHANEFDN